MKRKWILVVGLVLACGLLANTSIAGAEEVGAEPGAASLLENCEQLVCVYHEKNFGSVNSQDPVCGVSQVWTMGAPWKSAKNRCGNKSDWIRTNGTVVACMNPGGERPNPGTFNEVFIPVEYGAFC